MQNYALSQELASVFKENPWWTFMGKYFGFPECCVKDFCQSSVKIPSPFDGTGYVPCSCCNKLIVSDIVKQEFTLGINQRRYHNQAFEVDDNFENNPLFFKTMEEFYMNNKAFPYDEMIGRGGQEYLFNKFLDKKFSLDF